MDLKSYRASRGVTLEEAAAALGLRSKGYLSRLETGATPFPVSVALRVEAWSEGEVPAVDLLGPEDAKLLRAAIDRAAHAEAAA